MKVIGAGFGRTGTLSLKVALEDLGFGPCYHMVELFDKPDHVEFWDEAPDKVAQLAVPSMLRVPSMVSKVISDGTFDGRFDDREYAVKVFVRHIDEVKERIPAEKLLVYEVGEGWGPLCEFLGVEAPEKPFPHLNDRGEFPKMMRRQMVRVFAPATGKAVAAVSLLLVALGVLLRLVCGGDRFARRRTPCRPRTPTRHRRPRSS